MMAFFDNRQDLAEQVVDDDRIIDEREVEIEEECLKLLALHQPVAEDLRFIAAVMKINNDLERMGDSAVGIARRSLHYAQRKPIALPEELKKMTIIANTMVEQSLKAFVERDTALARAVCKKDDEADQLQASILKDLKNVMKTDSESISVALDLFTITRRLERIADLATNISEDVIYMVEGHIVRHNKNK